MLQNNNYMELNFAKFIKMIELRTEKVPKLNKDYINIFGHATQLKFCCESTLYKQRLFNRTTRLDCRTILFYIKVTPVRQKIKFFNINLREKC